MNLSPQEYDSLVRQMAPRSPLGKNVALAFAAGGAICCLGQAIRDGWAAAGLGADDAATATSVTLVFLSALLTGLGLYHKIARHAGAGTLVPITGFANSVAAPALEFKTEGIITGTSAKMFVIAGPVIVCGLSASVVYGLILCLLGGGA